MNHKSFGKCAACLTEKACRSLFMRVYRQRPDQVEKRKRHHKAHYALKRNGYSRRNAAWRAANLERARELVKRASAALYKRNPSKRKAVSQRSHEKKPWLANARSASRRARLLLQTPPWSDLAAIKEIFRNCPVGFHVDHIVPLKGKTVCGLHVPHNLRCIPASDNLKKYNKVLDVAA